IPNDAPACCQLRVISGARARADSSMCVDTPALTENDRRHVNDPMPVETDRFHFTCVVFVGDTLRRSEAGTSSASNGGLVALNTGISSTKRMREVGIEMELRESEPTTALNAARNGDFDMQLFNRTYGGSGGGPDASVTLRSDGLNNFSHWRNPEADK